MHAYAKHICTHTDGLFSSKDALYPCPRAHAKHQNTHVNKPNVFDVHEPHINNDQEGPRDRHRNKDRARHLACDLPKLYDQCESLLK